MFTTHEALRTRIRTRVCHLLASPSSSAGAPPAEGTVGNATATTHPRRTRPAAGAVLAAAAAAVTVAGSLVALAGPAAAVSLTGTLGNLPGIAVEGPGNSLDYYYQSDPGIWHEQQVAGVNTTYSAPSLALVGTTTVIAAEGSGNSLDFYVLTTSGTWQEQEAGAPGTTFSAPSVAGVNGTTWRIAAEGPNNSLNFYYPAFKIGSAVIWRTQQVAVSGTTYSAPSLAETYQGLGIAAEGSGNSLDFYLQGTSGTWPGQQVAKAGKTYSAPSLAMLNGSTGIAADGPGTSLMFYWQVDGLDTWHPQQVAAGPNLTHSAPSLAQLTTPDRIAPLTYPAIAVEGPAGFLDLYSRGPAIATPWQLLSVPGGLNSTHSAPSLAQIDESPAIAAEGPSNGLDYYNQPTPSSPWALQHVPGTGTFG